MVTSAEIFKGFRSTFVLKGLNFTMQTLTVWVIGAYEIFIGTNWSNFPICLWLEFKHHQDVSPIALYKSVLCIEKTHSDSPPAVHLLSALPEPAVIPAYFWLCWVKDTHSGKYQYQPGTGSDPTPRKQFIALTKWCSSFPDNFSLAFHIPEQKATFSSRHESYTRQVDSNPFLADYVPALPALKWAFQCPIENITEHFCLSHHLVELCSLNLHLHQHVATWHSALQPSF